VDATEGEGWFYEGAGIYRHVWLLKYGPVHIPQYGVFVRTTVGKGFADVAVETALFNAASGQTACDLTSAIVDDQGKTVSSMTARNVTLHRLREKRIEQTVRVTNPRLWSLETPTLYMLRSVLTSGGKTLDSVVTTFGIRQ
jgi:beta-galactosidase